MIIILLIINVCHTRALSLFSTAILLLVAVSGNSAAVLLGELDSAAAGLLRELEHGAYSYSATSAVATAAAERKMVDTAP